MEVHSYALGHGASGLNSAPLAGCRSQPLAAPNTPRAARFNRALTVPRCIIQAPRGCRGRRALAASGNSLRLGSVAGAGRANGVSGGSCEGDKELQREVESLPRRHLLAWIAGDRHANNSRYFTRLHLPESRGPPQAFTAEQPEVSFALFPASAAPPWFKNVWSRNRHPFQEIRPR